MFSVTETAIGSVVHKTYIYICIDVTNDTEISAIASPLCCAGGGLKRYLESVLNLKVTFIHHPLNMYSYVRFEVFAAVTMKNCVFWDVTPCGSCNNRRFGGT
jgi:hypothetical protein